MLIEFEITSSWDIKMLAKIIEECIILIAKYWNSEKYNEDKKIDKKEYIK